jgi:hypothetical protein
MYKISFTNTSIDISMPNYTLDDKIMYNTHKSIYIIDNWFVSMGGWYIKKRWGFSISKSKETSCALQHNYALTKAE